MEVWLCLIVLFALISLSSSEQATKIAWIAKEKFPTVTGHRKTPLSFSQFDGQHFYKWAARLSMAPWLKRQKKRTDSANIWQSMLAHNQAFTSQAAAPGTFITQVPLSHFLFTDKGSKQEIPGKGAVYYGLPNVHLLGCVYKSRKKKKETVVSTKNIKQRNIYKICHWSCGVFFPFPLLLTFFWEGRGIDFFCLFVWHSSTHV